MSSTDAAPQVPEARARSRRAAIVAGAMAVGLLGSGALVWQSTNAAFTGSAAPGANAWTAGRVSLSTSAGQSALFNASGLVPGSTGEKCIAVTYGGDVATKVRLFVASASGSLNDYIDLKVSLGTGGGANGACTGFSGTQFFSGTASAFATQAVDYPTGVGEWPAAQANDARTYKFTYTLSDNTPNSQQGAQASISFTWEARTP